VLDDIARTFSKYHLKKELCKDVHIYVGVHKFRRHLLPKGLNIGIQTEQFFDENGKKLWRHTSWLQMLRQVIQYDLTLDFSPANRPAYRFLPKGLRDRIVFGPKIFPDDDIQFLPSKNTELVFFGGLSARRAEIIQQLSTRCKIRTIKDGTFGEELFSSTKDSLAVLNLHHDEGIYTEIPRLLTAYLYGKPIYSEELGQPLVEGRHYLPIDAALDKTTAQEVFERFKREFVHNNLFSDFLEIINRKFGIYESPR
jgi:hypothetical protein